MKKTLIAGMVATLAVTSLAASAFASTPVVSTADQKKIEEVLTKLEALQEKHPDQIAYQKALELQAETTEKLTAADWKAIDAFHEAANKKQEAFLASKNVPSIPKSVLDAINVDEPTEAALDAFVEASNKQYEAIEALSEADYNTYDGFRAEADRLQLEYMAAHGVKFVDKALEARIQALDVEISALWEQMPESYYETYEEEGDHSMEAYMNV